MVGRRILAIVAISLLAGAFCPVDAHAEKTAESVAAVVPLERSAVTLPPMPAREATDGAASYRAGPPVLAPDGAKRGWASGRAAAAANGRWIRTSEAIAAASSGGGRQAAHAPEPGMDRFHLTVLRFWYYRDFLPKSDDSDILGVEINSAWCIGKLDFANIAYFELADYARAVPGRPAGNPEPELGAATGITDLLTAFLVSPKKAHHGPHHVAAGVSFQFPTASDPTIGSGKWAMGPAVEYEYHRGRFYAAFVALQLWSFAGDSSRKRVNMLMVKPMITYDLGHRWKAIYMPYGVSVYWDKPGGEKVYLPLGGGIQREFCIGSQKLAASLQFFQYVVRPTKGSEHDLRFMLEIDF